MGPGARVMFLMPIASIVAAYLSDRQICGNEIRMEAVSQGAASPVRNLYELPSRCAVPSGLSTGRIERRSEHPVRLMSNVRYRHQLSLRCQS